MGEEMRLILPTVIASTLLVASIVAQPLQPPSDESAILELEQRLAAAWVKGDRAFIDGLLANDWTVIDQAGRVLTKQQVLDETFASTKRRIEAMVVDDVKVRRLGRAAVATGRTRAAGSYRGQSATVTLRFTDVFHFRDGRWQIVASQGTTVAPFSSRTREMLD
jgi:ketosteroid isomerase-like protein